MTLLRHAKSSWDDPRLDDFNRPLNERGWKAARRIGPELKHRGIRFDLVLASTAARVRETIDGLKEKFEFDAPIRFEPQMYLASDETLLELVRGASRNRRMRRCWSGTIRGWSGWSLELTRDDDDGLRERVADKFPTGAFAVIELPVERWSDVAAGQRRDRRADPAEGARLELERGGEPVAERNQPEHVDAARGSSMLGCDRARLARRRRRHRRWPAHRPLLARAAASARRGRYSLPG